MSLNKSSLQAMEKDNKKFIREYALLKVAWSSCTD
jgi:hypothetical protein